jgi:hypothetical protein
MEGRYSPVLLLKLLGEEGRLTAVIRGSEQELLQGLAGPQPVRRLVGLGFKHDQLGFLLEPRVFTRAPGDTQVPDRRMARECRLGPEFAGGHTEATTGVTARPPSQLGQIGLVALEHPFSEGGRAEQSPRVGPVKQPRADSLVPGHLYHRG